LGLGPIGGSLLYSDDGKQIGTAWEVSAGIPISAKSSYNYTWVGSKIHINKNVDYTNPIYFLY